MNNLYVNIGNSAWHFLLDGQYSTLPHDSPMNIEEYIENLAGTKPIARVFLASVVGHKSDILAIICQKHQWPLVDVGQIRDSLPIRISTNNPQQTGIDRIINGLAHQNAPMPLLIFDMGTAITANFFDMMEDQLTFMGGLIAPGFRIMAESLNQKTAHLPLIPLGQLGQTPNIIAKDTMGAIYGGIFYQILGFLHYVANEFLQQQNGKTIIISGGGGAYFTGHCQFKHIFHEHLTLDSLAVLSHSYR